MSRKHSSQFLYDTLRMVAESTYDSEIVDEDITIGPGFDYETKEARIEEKVEEWIEDAEKTFSDMGPSLSQKEKTSINSIARLYYKMPLGSTIDIEVGMKVVRVPGGWVHIYQGDLGVSSCYIAWSDEFQQEGMV